nr:DUF4586 domain-containing protein [Xanthovirga aplysinae]
MIKWNFQMLIDGKLVIKLGEVVTGRSKKESGNGYILVTIDKVPYCGGAIGQISFSVDVYTIWNKFHWQNRLQLPLVNPRYQ